MKKLHLLLLILAAVFTSCKNDDDTANSYSQANLIGAYTLDVLRTSDTEIVTNPNGSTTETITYTSEGSNFDFNWVFNADGTFVVSGEYTNNVTNNTNGVITNGTQQTTLNSEGVYVANETNSTLIFTPVNDTDEVFDLTNFSANGFDARYENITTEMGIQERFVIDLKFIR